MGVRAELTAWHADRKTDGDESQWVQAAAILLSEALNSLFACASRHSHEQVIVSLILMLLYALSRLALTRSAAVGYWPRAEEGSAEYL